MKPRTAVAFLTFLIGASVWPQLFANDLPSVTAVRVDEAQTDHLEIDGLLNEEVWSLAQVATGLRQQEPDEGAPATEKTEVRILFDSHTLYLGVTAYDRNPDKIIARILQRDKIMGRTFDGRPRFAGDDAIAILFDPFHDHRNAVIFATNPNGAEFEALLSEEGQEFNIDWRAVWKVAAKRTPDGWSAEFAIPFRTLRYPAQAEGEPWGFNIYRVIRHKNEEVLWSAWSRDNEGFARVSRAGHLYGMVDLPRPGMNLELKPFALAGMTRELSGEVPSQFYNNSRADAGLDLKWEVRPGLVLDATLNTDFAQVEVDDEQVNLTRFQLFFPEKRDFFLENSGIFEFGYRGRFEPPPFLLFFSRRIGIASGNEVPVIGGIRLSGRTGRQTIGVLNMVTDRLETGELSVPRTNFAVVRVKRDIGRSNYLGVMLTDRRAGDSWNTTAGIDWSFWPGRRLNVQGFVARTATAGEGGDDYAYRLGMDYRSDHFTLGVQHLTIGPNARAEMGFITRTDIRRTNVSLRLIPRPPVLDLRMIRFFANGLYQTRLDSEPQDWNVTIGMRPEWNSGDSFVLFYDRTFTRLDNPFYLSGVLIPAGDYYDWQLGVFLNSSRNRSLVFNSRNRFRSFYGGRLTTLNAGLQLSVNANLSLNVSYTRNDVDLPNGAFKADIASLRFSYAFSTQFFTNALLQYNSLDNRVSANVRLNYIHRPGSDLFVVFTEERGSEASVWDLDNRALVVKLTYLYRF